MINAKVIACIFIILIISIFINTTTDLLIYAASFIISAAILLGFANYTKHRNYGNRRRHHNEPRHLLQKCKIINDTETNRTIVATDAKDQSASTASDSYTASSIPSASKTSLNASTKLVPADYEKKVRELEAKDQERQRRDRIIEEYGSVSRAREKKDMKLRIHHDAMDADNNSKDSTDADCMTDSDECIVDDVDDDDLLYQHNDYDVHFAQDFDKSLDHSKTLIEESKLLNKRMRLSNSHTSSINERALDHSKMRNRRNKIIDNARRSYNPDIVKKYFSEELEVQEKAQWWGNN